MSKVTIKWVRVTYTPVVAYFWSVHFELFSKEWCYEAEILTKHPPCPEEDADKFFCKNIHRTALQGLGTEFHLGRGQGAWSQYFFLKFYTLLCHHEAQTWWKFGWKTFPTFWAIRFWKLTIFRVWSMGVVWIFFAQILIRSLDVLWEDVVKISKTY